MEFCLFEVISLCILLLLSKLGVVDAISNKQVQSLQDMTYQEVNLEGDETCLARPQVEQNDHEKSDGADSVHFLFSETGMG